MSKGDLKILRNILVSAKKQDTRYVFNSPEEKRQVREKKKTTCEEYRKFKE